MHYFDIYRRHFAPYRGKAVIPRPHRRSRAPGCPLVHAPTLGVADTNVSPPGSVSVTTTPTAVEGPLLRTEMA